MATSPSNNPYGDTQLVDRLIGTAYDTVKLVAENLQYVKHVSVNLPHIAAVSEGIDSVKAIEDHLDQIIAVAADIANIDNVSENIISVNAVANQMVQLLALYQELDNVITVAGNITSVVAVGDHITAVQGVFNSISTIEDMLEALPQIEAIMAQKDEILDAKNDAEAARDLAQQYAQDALEASLGEGLATDAETIEGVIANKVTTPHGVRAAWDNWKGVAQSLVMVPESFAGVAGSNVEYELTTDLTTVTNIIVFVGGIRQRPTTDYTVSGTTLTILTNPDGLEVDTLIFDGINHSPIELLTARDQSVAAAAIAVAKAAEAVTAVDGMLKNDGSEVAVVQGINIAPDATNRLFGRGPLNLSTGISLRSKNQDDTVLQPLELEASQHRMTGGTLEIRPPAGTMTKALDIVQTGPATGVTGDGEAYFNQISSTFTASRTGSGIDGGSGSALVSGMHMGMACGGGGYNLQSISTLNVGCVPIAGDTSPGDKLAINSGLYIQYNSPGKIYGMSTGVTVDRTAGKSGYSPQICGFEVDMFLLGAGGSDSRIGFNAWSGGTHQASDKDTAFAVMSRGGTIDGAPVAPWKDGLSFMLNDVNPAISASGSMMKMDYTTTIANVIKAPSATITGHIIDTPNFRIHGSGAMEIPGGNGLTFDTGDRYGFDRPSNNHQFFVGGNAVLSINENNTHPGSNGTRNLGEASFRWATVFAATGTINTSDERKKQDIRDFTDAELDAWGNARTVAYRFKDAVEAKGDEARTHFGMIAQEVKAVFDEAGIDVSKFSLWCQDPVKEVVKKTRTILVPKINKVISYENRVEMRDGTAVLVRKEIVNEEAEMQTIPVHDEHGVPIMVTRDLPLRDAKGNIVYEKRPVVVDTIKDQEGNITPVFAKDENGETVYAVSSKAVIAHDANGNKLTYQEAMTHTTPVMISVEEEYEEEVETDEVVYGLRYEGCNAIEAAYQRRENARLSKRVADLEKILNKSE